MDSTASPASVVWGNASDASEEVFVWGEPPVSAWCFDLIVFYRTIGDDQSMIILEQLAKYSKFSFAVNGVITCVLAAFGLVGNATLFYQIRHSRHFSKRLASHLKILCVWDMMLLLCCLVTYGVISLYYGLIPFVGIVAYILYLFQPFASFCVTGTIWQVCAITIERYMAVSRPLEQRTMKAQFSVRSIAALISVCAFVLNIFVVPFERKLNECYEITESGFQVRTMITQLEIVNNQFYAILVHLIPDIIFRAPLPIIAIAVLTVRTLQICRHRTVGHHTITSMSSMRKKNIPFMLTLLNAKFILCNTLYMVNTFLMEVMGYGSKTNSQSEEYNAQQYISSLYLTDISNALLVLHSSTNWLLFCHWPSQLSKSDQKMDQTEQMSTLMSGTSISKTSLCDAKSAETLLSRFLGRSESIAKEAVIALCGANERFAEFVTGEPFVNAKTIAENEKTKEVTASVSRFIEQLLRAFADKTKSLGDIRVICRKVGYDHFDANIHCSVEQFKSIREVIVRAIAPQNQRSSASLHRSATRIYNWTLREIKSGALCATVDAQQLQQFRIHKTSMAERSKAFPQKQPLRRLSTVIPRLLSHRKNTTATLTPLTYIIPPQQTVFKVMRKFHQNGDSKPAPKVHNEDSHDHAQLIAVSEC